MAERRILIVEDDLVAARELEQQLSGGGYQVATVAFAGDETIAAAARLKPDVVLISTPLRSDSGRKFTKELQASYPIVFAIDEKDEASSRGTDATEPDIVLVRPFTDRELSATVELAVCRHARTISVRETESRFFENSIDMLCFLDFNGHFKLLNPAWERTLGFTREELMSRPFIEFVHPDDRERTLKQNSNVRAGGQALAFENRYMCKDGSYRWFLWNAIPDSAESVIYSMARDITVARRAREEREQLVRDLQSALAEVNSLREILPICSYCKKIRDDENYWHTVESYISLHTSTLFSHGICPSCMESEVESQLE